MCCPVNRESRCIEGEPASAKREAYTPRKYCVRNERNNKVDDRWMKCSRNECLTQMSDEDKVCWDC
ncbi:hypothetical protein WN55_10854 [Dufourea novaeangliae]|uniref:Uncharacterized protein n=1 Tax=Dufourea novaeangliae TaxID=178035 RepID=A0A154P9C1_DUFNO|nr:hypothetical protein WN55_10854 [Dufourea novaeangliae]